MKKYNRGITTGVFDLFHVGHLNLLERCKEHCDYLIVAVCDDDYVKNIKHKEPVFSLEERVRIISALKCVDETVVVSYEEVDDKMLLLEKHNFDVLFSGDDWKGSERYKKTEEQFAKVGAAIEYLPYTQGVSTTQIKESLKK
ncbi:MAG: adenylyltransferase/cytidyltransferase family protein [Clostridia bacterium]|nr:adenylyltransferase/cytidyltransferase family protein [Clostridia bacterium]